MIYRCWDGINLEKALHALQRDKPLSVQYSAIVGNPVKNSFNRDKFAHGNKSFWIGEDFGID